jgi:hypothetical protein
VTAVFTRRFLAFLTMRTALLLAALQGAAARGGKGCEGDGGCGKALVNPCIDPSSNQSKLLWCDHTQPISARAKDAVSHLTQAEKICSLDTGGCANPSLGLPDYNWWSEASSGVGNHAHAATKFACTYPPSPFSPGGGCRSFTPPPPHTLH